MRRFASGQVPTVRRSFFEEFPMIIDAHIHMYPPEVHRDPMGWARGADEPYWALLITDRPDRPSIQGWATVEQLLSDMDRAGVERVVMQGMYWQHLETCVVQNNWYIEWCSQYPDRLMGFAVVQPRAGDRALDEVRRAVDAGLRGLGEMLPYAQGYDIRNPDFLRVVELLIELKVPLCLHVSEPVGHVYPGKSTTPLEDYYWLATEYPELKLILAHWGGLLPFYELMKGVRKQLMNVYYDTAATPLLYHQDVYQSVVNVVGPEKILYGSDYPLLIYPSQERAPGFSRLLDEIRGSGLSPDELDLVLGGNVARLLGV
jgi:predicted TIM-barrel fold metal-dependent hydrolase